MNQKNLSGLRLVVGLLVALFALPNASGATVPVVFDQKICTGSAPTTGGTMTCDYATTTDRALRVVASVGMSSFSAAHLANGGLLTCEAIFENKNGTLTLATARASSNNPANDGTGTFVAAHAQALDVALVSGGGSPSTCAWSVSGTNARLTVTNQSTTVAADVTVWLQAFAFGSQ